MLQKHTLRAYFYLGFWIALFLGANQVLAKDNPFLFIRTSDQFGQRPITCIQKDSQDYLWVGTYGGGLKKYDGNSVKTYRHNFNSTEALASSIINNLHIDQNDQLWIGTSNGLHAYNVTDDTFRHYTYNGDSFSVNALASLDQRTLIVGTHQSGLYFFDIQNKNFTKITIPKHLEESSFLINDIVLDMSQRIWVGTNNGLMLLDASNMTLSEVITNSKRARALLQKDILSLMVDASNTIWVGTVQSGVLKIPPANTTNLEVIQYKATQKRVFDITAYTDGNILFGTENDGLFLLNGDDGSLMANYTKTFDDSFSIQSNSIWSLYTDNESRIWLGYYDQGVDTYDPKHFKFNFLSNKSKKEIKPFPSSVSAISKDAQGRIWFSSVDRGVFVYDSKKETYTDLNDPKNKLAKGLNSLDTPSIYIDKKENVWIASWYSGVYLLKKGSKQFLNFNTTTNPDIFLSDRIASFSEDTNGTIWISSFFGGLISYNPKTEKFKHHASELFAEFGLTRGNIRKVLADSGDNIWMGSRKGLYMYSPKTETIRSFNEQIQLLTNNTTTDIVIFSIYEDLNKTIWIGTDGLGVFSYSPTEDNMEYHDALENVDVLSVNAITQTNDGLYWFGSDNGLVRYNSSTKSTRKFESSDGLLGNRINRNAFFNDKQMLYVGTTAGINYFDYSELQSNELVPSLRLSRLKIANKIVPIEKEGPLPRVINELDTLVLSHDQSSFSIDYIGINYTRGDNNNYAYMLENFEQEWNYVNSSLSATYTNIKPGFYTFKLIGSNNDGVWTSEAKKLYIKITPPWWNTLLFRLSYVLATIFIGLYIYRLIYLKTKEKRKAILEREKRKQTEELNANKIQFFTNISHEFRTPLTLILNPLESVISGSGSFDLTSETKNKLSIVQKNAQRMKRLIDELMDFRKIQFSNINVQAQRFVIHENLESILSNFKQEANDRNITLKTNYKLKKDILWADPSMFEKIIFNLLSNAFKATPDFGSISIEADFKEKGVLLPLIDPIQPTAAFEVIVRDSGFGIKKENLKKIFSRFYQDKDNNKQYYGGTGIGLEVVSTFVEYHKGKIEVESVEKEGSRFKVYFPAGKNHFEENQIKHIKKGLVQQAVAVATEADAYDSKEDIVGEKSKKSILIVEDNVELRDYLKKELNSSFTVYEAGNGKIGLEMSKLRAPDVIITDVMMPEMDGIEMCNALKSSNKTSTIPVIMLTAKVAEQERISGIESGADVYLKKPFSLELLKSHLKHLMRSKDYFYDAYFNSLELDIDGNSSDKKLVSDAINVIGEQLSNESLSVQEIAEHLNLSRSKLYRKIKSLTNMSANELIRKIRLEKSKELLEQTDLSVGEICFRVGFSSPSYFTKRFKSFTGLVPKEYRLQNKKIEDDIQEPILNLTGE